MINSEINQMTYTTVSGVATYTIGFVYFLNTSNEPELQVTLDGVTLVYGRDYTLSEDELSIEFIVDPDTEEFVVDPGEGKTLIISRDVPLTQTSDYVVGRIDPDQIERDFDRSVMRDQDIRLDIGIIESKIPDDASPDNQLVDKAYVDAHTERTDNPHSVTKSQVGLGNCDNTSDLNKPISTATQAALDLKANSSDLAAVATAGTLSSLTDTDFTNLSAGNFIMFDGLKWKNVYSSATASWGTILGNITDQTDLKDALDAKVNLNGTSIMTAPLKFSSGSMRGAVSGYLNGVSFWKMDAQGNIANIANLTDSQFLPVTTNSIDIGRSANTWKDLYLGGKIYVATINNGYDISVPAYAGTMLVADSTGATAGQYLALNNNLKPVWANVATVATTGSYNDLLNKPTIPTVNNATLTITQGGVSKGTFTANASSDVTIDLDAGGGSSNYQPDLFDFKWADHELDDMSWLRADTFSWQSGSTYKEAYKHLRNDMYQWYSWENNGTTIYTKKMYPDIGEKAYTSSALTTEVGEITAIRDDLDDERITVSGVEYDGVSGGSVVNTWETVAGVSIPYIPAADGHKIVTFSYASDVESIYAATGVAWYYIVDYGNKRFKLPRTKFGMTGLRDTVGKYVSESVPNLKGYIADNPNVSQDGTLFYEDGTENSNGYGSNVIAHKKQRFDASRYSSAYQDSAPVQQRATQMYLYFYVGSFTQTALENTAGLNASLFNGKADLDLANVLANIDYVVESQTPNAGNNYTWYRKYRSGWVEQGGLLAVSGGSSGSVVLPVEMSSDYYNIFIQTYDSGDKSVIYTDRTSTGFNYSGNVGKDSWEVKGMAAS